MSAAETGGDITNLQLLSQETIEMKRKILVVALSLMATMLLATSSFAQSCSGFTGANVQFIAAGSSAQFNSFAFAAEGILTGHFNFWAASGGVNLQDTRFGIANSSSPVDGAKVWVAWDDNTDCSVYVYYSIDSTVGVKDFFAYNKVTATTSNGTVNIVQGAVYSTTAAATNGASTGWTTTCNEGSIVNAGQPPCQRTDVTTGNPVSLPSAIALYLQAPPSPATKTSLPPAYCGTSTKTTTTTGFWCTINAGATDIRPEDALYATTRALSAYSTANGLTGLGYANAGCGAASTLQGCDIGDSFGQKRQFHVLSFKISGTDPKTLAALPKYTTLSTGAAPILVFVNDGDTSAGGFGSKDGSGNYIFNDILRKDLALLYEGTSHCTGDILSSAALPGGIGSGKPIQIVQREPLSGTYNTFEFNAVRSLSGSAAASVKWGAKSALQWVSGDSSGQELNVDPTQNFNTASCPLPNGSGAVPTGGTACGDPLYQTVGTAGIACNGGGANQSIRVRAIGTGDLVKAAIGTFNSITSAASPGWSVSNGLGYAFWGYGNFAPTASGCATNSGAVTCSTYKAHYLTVDGIDPLFTTEGGQGDSAYTGGANNPNGAFHAPQCNLSANPISCFPIPFTHVADGKYPIWSLLRITSFANVFNSGTSGPLKLATPPGVLNMVANAEIAANDVGKSLDDFVPFLTNLNNGGTLAAPVWTGDLNLGVFRAHYKQTGGAVNPFNGHADCTGFTGVALAGGTSGAPTCLVDAGNDVGGSVLTVQQDVDFNLDFGSLFSAGNYELYNLHQ